MFQTKVAEKMKDILCSVIFFNPAVYELVFKSSVEQWVIWRKRIFCWIPKATHAREVCNVAAFPRQNGLHVRTSMLHYT